MAAWIAVGVGVAVLGLAAAGGARGWATAALSRRIGRPVHVDGQFSLTPGWGGLTLGFTHLRVDQPSWAGPGSMIAVDRGLARLPWTVLIGDARVQDVELDGVQLTLRRTADGRADWKSAGQTRTPALPDVGRIIVHHGVIDFQDAERSVSFRGAADAVVDHGASRLSVSGAGLAAGAPWRASVVSSQAVFGSARYDLVVRAALDQPAGRSSVDFNGRLSLSKGGELTGRLAGAGPDLHAISQVTHLPLPRTPPYQLQGQIAASGKQVRLDQVTGRIGASDVEGRLTVTPAPGGRSLDGDLRSRSLRISDLFAVASGGELTKRRPGRLLPDAGINAAPLRKLSGQVRFVAAHVQPPTTPTIDGVRLVAVFDRGRVAAAPLVLDLAHGRAVLRSLLDVRGPVSHLDFSAEMQGVDTADIFKAKGRTSPLQARFNAAIQLQGSGGSVAAAAAHSVGSVSLRALGGRLQEIPADVLSANLARGLISLLSRSQAEVALRCAVARFQVVDGEARATDLRISTDVGGAVGYGGFNLGAETVDLTLRPSSALSGPSSVRIDGPLLHPRATLALDDPGGVLRKTLNGLLPKPRPAPAGVSDCS